MELCPTGRIEFFASIVVDPEEPAEPVIDAVFEYLRSSPGYEHETWRLESTKRQGLPVEFDAGELPGSEERERLAPVLRKGFSCLGKLLGVYWAPQRKKPKYPVSAEEPTPGWLLRICRYANGRSTSEVLAAFDAALAVVEWSCASFPVLEAHLFCDTLKGSSVGFAKGIGWPLGRAFEEQMIEDTFRDPRAFWSTWDQTIPIEGGRRFVWRRPVLREPEDTLAVIHSGMQRLRVTEHNKISHSKSYVAGLGGGAIAALPRILRALPAQDGALRFDVPPGAGRLTDGAAESGVARRTPSPTRCSRSTMPTQPYARWRSAWIPPGLWWVMAGPCGSALTAAEVGTGTTSLTLWISSAWRSTRSSVWR